MSSDRANFNYSGQYTGQSVSGPNGTNPNVLVGAGDFRVTNTVIRAGAMAAVGGQQKILIKGRAPNNNPSTNTSDYAIGDYPSVLPGFHGSISGATVGAAAFCAVGGNRNLHPTSGHYDAATSNMTVLPNLNGENFPQPVNGYFEDGSYSAVARNRYSSSDGPSVLRDFRHFEANNVRLLPGALAAVGGDQTVEYNDTEGVEVGEEGD